MRLIDADALIGKLHTQFLYDGRDRTRIYECIQAQPTAQPEPCEDAVSRRAAINTVKKHYRVDNDLLEVIVYQLENLPSAQPEVRPIDYQDCSNAMLKMWMDNVVTDGEYNRIMDKLNVHWGVEVTT